jgi:uncharacterized phage-associated protein
MMCITGTSAEFKNEEFGHSIPVRSTYLGSEDVDEGLSSCTLNQEAIPLLRQDKVIDVSPHEVSCLDVADYILRQMGEISTMKLQKLVYYCQAWSLVWDEVPIFKEPIEAWANGPVIRSLFDYHRGMFKISRVLTGNPDLLSSEQRETINAVLDFYGDKSAQWLIDLAHTEDPWLSARRGLAPTERGNRIIKLDNMAEYYSSL